MMPEQQQEILDSGSAKGGMPGEEAAGFAQGSHTVMVAALTDEEREALEAELQAAELTQREALDATLATIATTLLAQRGEAISGRKMLGVEDEWLEDQEAYDGVDDANRGEEARYRARKPAAGGSAVSKSSSDDDENRSTVFLNITAPFTDAAAAKVADMLLPSDDRNWSLEASPIPDMPGETPTDSALPANTAADLGPQAQALDAKKADAKRRAENAQRRIDDWLTDCNVQRELRAVIKSAARLGTGVLKGPFAAAGERMSWATDPAGGAPALTKNPYVCPKSRAISLWDFFPDPSCGQNIHNGSYVWERDRLGEPVVAALRGQPGYFEHQLEAVLLEGPKAPVYEGGPMEIGRDAAVQAGKQFETWYVHGFMKREDLEAVGCECPADMALMIPIMGQFINDRLVRVAVNPLSKGQFPYDLLPWSEREGICYGIGVPRKGRAPQRMVNAATRNMLDNAALSAGLILLLRTAGLTPQDGKWTLHGRKIFLVDDNAAMTKTAEHSIEAVDIPSRVNELMVIINFALKMMEDVTGLPALLQGQQGEQAISTLGTAQILSNNANVFLRSIAKAFDDYVTEPHIGRYVDWIKDYGDEQEIGDYTPDARGSSALVERELQNQWIASMAAYVKDPEFRINPSKWFEEFSKSVRFDPKRIQYTDDEWEQKSAQPPPVDPSVQVAQIRAESAAAVQAERSKAEALQAQIEAEGRVRAAAMALASEEQLSDKEVRARMLEVLATDRRARDQDKTKRDLFVAETVVKNKFGEGI